MKTGISGSPSCEVSVSMASTRAIRATPKKPPIAEFLIMAMMTLPSGTMAYFHAWGSTT